MNEKVKITLEELEDMKRSRMHTSKQADKVLILSRDLGIPLIDDSIYVDLCYYNPIKHKWEGILDIDKVPTSERKRLDGLYANKNVVLFCKISDVDTLAEMVKNSEKATVIKHSELSNKFK